MERKGNQQQPAKRATSYEPPPHPKREVYNANALLLIFYHVISVHPKEKRTEKKHNNNVIHNYNYLP
jgi:hypothetical protein